MELIVENLRKRFGTSYVLDGVNFKLTGGEVALLLGANAAGKSTLLKILATIMKPTSGKILFDGVDIVKNPEVMRKAVSYNPEFPILVNELSLDENLRFFSRLFDYKGDLENLKKKFKLSDGRKNVMKLSKGMRQRLSLAISMMRDPKVVILDEPTSGLDRETIHFTLDLISQLSQDGKIVIVCSHDEEDLAKVATRVLILEDGSLVCDMPLEEVERNRLVEIIYEGKNLLVKLSELEKIKDYKIIRVLGIRESLASKFKNER